MHFLTAVDKLPNASLYLPGPKTQCTVNSLIVLKNVVHKFGSRTVLDGISLDLTERRIAFIGANGSGKSTLVRTFNGLLLPDQGEILVDGLDVRKNLSKVRRKVGFIFSDANSQIIMPTVSEDVAIGLRRLKLSRQEGEERVNSALARYGLLEQASQSPHLLSGGQKQMLALASVLVTEPEVLVCDEPTTLLDLYNVELFVDTLRELEQQVILLTHHLDIIEDFDRVIVIDAGRVSFDGRPTQAIDHYRALIRDRWSARIESLSTRIAP
ncbi:energy-coupling factor ABC transporter ATP-binding protein [Silvibacterium sp.]|uniref:energy-coupling factor ABC transporter ATP-binding protein n=1 Tax=Silvibacterium sp. TaxID=1964179 RepID=UPI0039E6FC58